ncbi:hypothetical protein [Streptomyces sp. NPDC096323]|uniref:hypothetical protein n=1 Tax=Streptomyces sp. NPDC096323 TaxID=3155822 RepID=UPI0033272810
MAEEGIEAGVDTGSDRQRRFRPVAAWAWMWRNFDTVLPDVTGAAWQKDSAGLPELGVVEDGNEVCEDLGEAAVVLVGQRKVPLPQGRADAAGGEHAVSGGRGEEQLGDAAFEPGRMPGAAAEVGQDFLDAAAGPPGDDGLQEEAGLGQGGVRGHDDSSRTCGRG